MREELPMAYVGTSIVAHAPSVIVIGSVERSLARTEIRSLNRSGTDTWTKRHHVDKRAILLPRDGHPKDWAEVAKKVLNESADQRFLDADSSTMERCVRVELNVTLWAHDKPPMGPPANWTAQLRNKGPVTPGVTIEEETADQGASASAASSSASEAPGPPRGGKPSLLE
jgi:hypothetical protein